MDVTSLYTNIPLEEGILACKNFLRTRCFQEYNTQNISNIIQYLLNAQQFRIQRASFSSNQRQGDGNENGSLLYEHIHGCPGRRYVEQVPPSTPTLPQIDR